MVRDWFVNPSAGKQKRLAFLCEFWVCNFRRLTVCIINFYIAPHQQ